ncbi:hypothetical protein ACJX0J_017377, partial [Zea mays]
IFGCPAYAHVNNGKLVPRAQNALLLAMVGSVDLDPFAQNLIISTEQHIAVNIIYTKTNGVTFHINDLLQIKIMSPDATMQRVMLWHEGQALNNNNKSLLAVRKEKGEMRRHTQQERSTGLIYRQGNQFKINSCCKMWNGERCLALCRKNFN